MTDWSWKVKEKELAKTRPTFFTQANGWKRKMTEDTGQESVFICFSSPG